MAAYLVVAVDIKDSESYKKYSEAAGAVLHGFDIEELSAEAHTTLYEGERPANHLVLMKFESKEKFEEFYQSEAYRRAIPLRDAASDTRFIMLMDSPED